MNEEKVYNFSDLVEYFNDRPDVQSKLIRMRLQNKVQCACEGLNLAIVLFFAFSWVDTLEGGNYWSEIYSELSQLVSRDQPFNRINVWGTLQ